MVDQNHTKTHHPSLCKSHSSDGTIGGVILRQTDTQILMGFVLNSSKAKMQEGNDLLQTSKGPNTEYMRIYTKTERGKVSDNRKAKRKNHQNTECQAWIPTFWPPT